MLAEVTLEELSVLIGEKIVGGYQSEKQDGRRRLRTVVDELASSAGDAVDDDLLSARMWQIAEVRISGIGGIAALEPQPLTLAPTPGVTVVRGLNGQGKTSLARGLDCGLRGGRDAGDEVAGQLWTADLMTTDVETATVELALVHGADRLTLHTAFSVAGSPTVTATLTDADGTRSVHPGEMWRRRLLGSRVCYSYGALQNRLTDDRALQGYLEELLILGPVWQQVRSEIVARSDQASQAQKVVNAARRVAVDTEKEIHAGVAADERSPAAPPAVTWPKANDGIDVEAWLRSTGLHDHTAQPEVRVGTDHEARIERLDSSLGAADEALRRAEETLDSPGFGAALHHIERLVAVEDLDSETCPLCGTAADWRAHARHITAGLHESRAASGALRRALSDLATWVDSDLVPLMSAGVPGAPVADVAAFREAKEAGHDPYSSAHQAARTLLDNLQTDEYRSWVAGIRAMSDAAAEWRARSAAAVHTYAEVLKEHGATAAEAGVWKKAEGALDDLQVELRQERQDGVTQQLHAVLNRMLPDADIELSRIHHAGGAKQQRGVEVGLTIGGREATLGMLSSGQRNALLLTPLLILDDAGPFGFLVVDDPVHALDDVRTDLLARELAWLADRRQVIVLTHDPRLEEHLRARTTATTTVELQRDARTRTVRWSVHTAPWEALLDDARDLWKGARPDGWAYSESMASVVAGLCRTAVDGALRQAVITRAVQCAADVEQALNDLGEERETRARIEHVISLAGGPGQLVSVERGRDEHLNFWNKGAHGQLPSGVDLGATIEAASAACAELTTRIWSTP